MVRFKVVRASRLLLYIAVVLLVAVFGFLLYRMLSTGRGTETITEANLVEAGYEEAKAEKVFASANAAETSGKPLFDGSAPITVEIVKKEEPEAARPSVLIYHTHTHEAYEQVNDDPYRALEAWRTTDADHSVVRVGTELAKQLEGYGFEVVHDTTDCEGSELSTAYTRSLEALNRYDRPFDLYIDLHRDAWIDGMERAFTLSGGVASAQLMMLIGNGNGFDEKPYYAQNLAFARALEGRINAAEPGLCKPVLVKDGRYNQHIGVFSILVEVGHNKNTLDEALNAVPALAQGIHSLLVERPDSELTQMKAEYDAVRKAS